MSEVNGRKHVYHAEATVLKGHLRLPVAQEIKPQAFAQLPERGGYITQRLADYRLESVISFRSAYSQVSGTRSTKQGQGWSTLTTCVIEGLNVLDVVTADRVVGQTITEHPVEGYVPSISFLGTRFENLRIGGHPVKLDLDLDLFGSKPAGDAPYTKDAGFVSRVSSQYERIHQHKDLPDEIHERYNRLPASFEKSGSNQEKVECSLVNNAEGTYPGRTFGHVIKVPDFGTITLARLTLEHEDFKEETGAPKRTTVHLTMLDFKLGCVIDGIAPVGTGSTNGGTQP